MAEAGDNPSEQGRLSLDERLPLKVGLGSAFAGVIGYARSMVERAQVDPIAAVHEYRKALRRARAVVRLSRPLLGGVAFGELVHELRVALRGTSPLRDSTVLLETLDRLPDHSRTRRARKSLHRLLRSEEDEAARQKTILELQRSVHIVAPLPGRFSALLPQDVGWREVRDALAKSFRRARRARRRARHSGEDQDVHAFRKRVKELRYQIELLEAALPGRARRDHRDLAALAEGLGEVTDLTLLRRAVRLRAPELPRPRPLVTALDGRIAQRLCELYAGSGHLFSRRPRDFAARAVRRFH